MSDRVSNALLGVGARSDGRQPIDMSSNTSPYGPSPAAIDAMQALVAEAHTYPDRNLGALTEALAAHEGVDPDRIAPGAGSAGVIMDVIARACSEGGSVVAFEHAFHLYGGGAAAAGAQYLAAPVSGPGLVRDPAALLACIDSETKVVCIDNPPNPTTDHLTGGQLRDLVAAIPEDVVVIVDEAYHQYALGQRGYATVAELGLDHPRLVTTRTFSKVYGLAGIRVGYGVGPSDLIREVNANRIPFSVNKLAEAAARASLADTAHRDRAVAGVIAGRARLAASLVEAGLTTFEGVGNHVLVLAGDQAQQMAGAYAEHGIRVNTLSQYDLPLYLRLTVPLPEQLDTFFEVSAQVLAGMATQPVGHPS